MDRRLVNQSAADSSGPEAEEFLRAHRVQASVPSIDDVWGALRGETHRRLHLRRVLMVAAVCAELALVLAYLVVELVHDTGNAGVIVLLLQLMFGCCILAVDANINENKSALVGFFAVSALLSAYNSYAYLAIDSSGLVGGPQLQLARFIVGWLFLAGNAVVVVLGFSSFGWHLTRIVGTNSELRRAYSLFQGFRSMLVLDLISAVAAVTMVGLYWFREVEIVVDAVALVVSVAWMALGWIGARCESRAAMAVWFALAPIEPAYLIAKVVLVLVSANLTLQLVPFVVLFCFAVGVRAILVVSGALLVARFDAGLKETVFASKPPAFGGGAVM